MRTLLLLSLLALLVLAASEAIAARPVPLHHVESGYVGSDYWASVPYTRGYEVTATRALTLRGLSIYADFSPLRTCEPRVYDASGTLRTAGPAQNGIGDGSGNNVDWWTLPISTELYAGETVTLAIYCTASTTTAHYPHRDPPTAQLDAEGYFTNAIGRSNFGDGFPDSENTWWGDWRIEIEGTGLHDQYVDPTRPGTTGTMSNSRGASLVTTRPLSITAIDLYLDLEVGETCTPQVFDSNDDLIAEGTDVNGAGAGLRWYGSDLAVALDGNAAYTIAQYCEQATEYGRWWNDSSLYSVADVATNVRGRSGGGDGVAPTTANAITPILQIHEGQLEVTNRGPMDATSSTSSWSSWSWGWRLQPEVSMTVLGLEALMTRSGGTARARIYDTATGLLLSSSDTPMPTSEQLEWREAPLPPTLLAAGGDYTVAVFYEIGSTNAPYVGGSAGSYSRPGVATSIEFCGSGSSSDVIPAICSYNHRVERLRVDLPEPHSAIGLALGACAIAGLGARSRRRPTCTRG